MLFLIYRYSPEERAKIGEYACIHGSAAAARHFSKKLGSVSESSVKSIKTSYIEAKRKRSSDSESIKSLPTKKRGRPLLLGSDLDGQLQLYLKKIRANGGPLTARIAIAAARGLILADNRNKLVEYGGHIELNRHWAYSLYKRMGFVQRKPTTSKGKYDMEDFHTRKASFLDDVVSTVEMEEIPPEMIFNWDQTGVKLVPSTSWSLEHRGAKRVEVAGQNDKRLVTAVLCGTLQGDFLPLQIIYKGKTDRCHPKYTFPPGWHITHSPNHWSTETTMLEYVEHIIIPYVRNVREMLYTETTPGLIIMDNFKGQVTVKVNDLLETNHLHVCLLPPNTTDLLQPMDISVNKPVKSFLKDQFAHWYAEQLLQQCEEQSDVPLEDVVLKPIDMSMAIMKNVSAKWFVKMAEYIADNPQFIVNGFKRAGICRALDGICSDDELDDVLDRMYPDYEFYTDSETSDD